MLAFATVAHPKSELVGLAGVALAVAREAGELVSAGFRSRPHVDHKGRHDLVTEYDRRSQELVLARLATMAPGMAVVAEEDRPDAAGAPASATRGPVWYVDPLDGTTNFVHGHPFWCVAIGLLDGDEPLVGAIVAPRLALEWSGYRASDGAEARRNGEACTVSGTETLAESLVGTGFPPTRDVAPDNNFDSFVSVKKACQAVRRCGSAAIDLCLVADGTYDGYWERRLHPWDVVGGSTLVLAAGGRVTSLSGERPDYAVGYIVASNGRIHDPLVSAVGAGR